MCKCWAACDKQTCKLNKLPFHGIDDVHGEVLIPATVQEEAELIHLQQVTEGRLLLDPWHGCQLDDGGHVVSSSCNAKKQQKQNNKTQIIKTLPPRTTHSTKKTETRLECKAKKQQYNVKISELRWINSPKIKSKQFWNAHERQTLVTDRARATNVEFTRQTV